MIETGFTEKGENELMVKTNDEEGKAQHEGTQENNNAASKENGNLLRLRKYKLLKFCPTTT